MRESKLSNFLGETSKQRAPDKRAVAKIKRGEKRNSPLNAILKRE